MTLWFLLAGALFLWKKVDSEGIIYFGGFYIEESDFKFETNANSEPKRSVRRSRTAAMRYQRSLLD